MACNTKLFFVLLLPKKTAFRLQIEFLRFWEWKKKVGRRPWKQKKTVPIICPSVQVIQRVFFCHCSPKSSRNVGFFFLSSCVFFLLCSFPHNCWVDSLFFSIGYFRSFLGRTLSSVRWNASFCMVIIRDCIEEVIWLGFQSVLRKTFGWAFAKTFQINYTKSHLPCEPRRTQLQSWSFALSGKQVENNFLWRHQNKVQKMHNFWCEIWFFNQWFSR